MKHAGETMCFFETTLFSMKSQGKGKKSKAKQRKKRQMFLFDLCPKLAILHITVKKKIYQVQTTDDVTLRPTN